MGTRHLIAVYVGGEYKVAQYGQWDGYPSAQGATVLEFARTADMKAFADKCRAARWVPVEELRAAGNDWLTHWPHMTRDLGAGILQTVMDAEPGIGLQNSIDFAGDSLFCEWAYVLDLDSNTLEVFGGFSKDAPPDDSRFAGAVRESDSEYFPVSPMRAWKLDDLPSEATFIAECDPPQDGDE